MGKDNNKFKVKIVAIAKDEGAYIAEWVFHHLYFGFDAIDIYVNRTTDNTCSILDVIGKKYPQVNYIYVDWIDMLDKPVSARMQKIIYAQAHSEEKKKDEYTHILFIDIDEFWTPVNFKDSIHDCLDSLPPHSSISFQWFNIFGEKSEFGYLPKTINGFYSPLVKSLCSTGAEIKEIALHIPRFHNNEKFKGSFFSDGSLFIQSKKHYGHIKESDINLVRPYILLHRMFRSEIEYLSLLYRGNPEERSNFKLNRQHGFLKTKTGDLKITFPKTAYFNYERKRDDFFNELNFEEELMIARTFVLKRAEKTMAALPNELDNNFEVVSKQFKNVTNPEVLVHFKEHENRKQNNDKCRKILKKFNEKKYENATVLVKQIISLFEQCDDNQTVRNIENEYDLILKCIHKKSDLTMGVRDIALYFEGCNNIEQAYIIMKMAHRMNPNGPVIKNKIKAYKLKLK